jgi:hypothetical protein
VFFTDKDTGWYVRAWGRERSLKKARHIHKTNTALRRGERNCAVQTDRLANEPGAVMCQLFVVVLLLLEYD